MKREIKFRVFDKSVPANTSKQELNEPTGMMIPWDYVKESSYFLSAIDGKYPIMQFTGLKDKNGVEIYEGDILENTKSYKGNFFVKWNVGGYDAVYKGNFTLCLYPILHDFDGANIIGNIYQNPGLI